MTDPVVIVGGGGHAKVVADILQGNGVQIAGCLCPDGCNHVPGVPWLGESYDVETLRSRGLIFVHVAVGDNAVRNKLAQWFLEQGFRLASAVSCRAAVSSHALIGAGVSIMPGAVVNACTQIDDCSIINTGASVDHDCRIGKYAHIGPGCHLAGNVHVGEGTFLGIGSTVIPGIRIGDWSIVGAGAVVIRPVPDGVTAVGVPARMIKTAGKVSSGE